MTDQQLLLAGMGVLATVIVALWGQTRLDYKRIIEQLDVCTKERLELKAENAVLESQIKFHAKRISGLEAHVQSLEGKLSERGTT